MKKGWNKKNKRIGQSNQNKLKNLLMPLFLMGCFPVDFQEAKRPLRIKSGKRPTKAGKRPIKEGKRPMKVMVLVGISVGCLVGCFRAPPPWRKTAPLKRPIKRSMIIKTRMFSRKGLDEEKGGKPPWFFRNDRGEKTQKKTKRK